MSGLYFKNDLEFNLKGWGIWFNKISSTQGSDPKLCGEYSLNAIRIGKCLHATASRYNVESDNKLFAVQSNIISFHN